MNQTKHSRKTTNRTSAPRGSSSPHRLWGVKPFCSTPCFYLFMVRVGVGAWMSALGRRGGEGNLLAKPLVLSLFLSYFPFFFFSISLFLKKIQKNPTATTTTKKNITMPFNKRHSGKQWILRTYRKAGISWIHPSFCQARSPHQGEEREKRACMERF